MLKGVVFWLRGKHDKGERERGEERTRRQYDDEFVAGQGHGAARVRRRGAEEKEVLRQKRGGGGTSKKEGKTSKQKAVEHVLVGKNARVM